MYVLFHFSLFSCKASRVNQSCWFRFFIICWLPFKANSPNTSLTLRDCASSQRNNSRMQISLIFGILLTF